MTELTLAKADAPLRAYLEARSDAEPVCAILELQPVRAKPLPGSETLSRQERAAYRRQLYAESYAETFAALRALALNPKGGTASPVVTVVGPVAVIGEALALPLVVSGSLDQEQDFPFPSPIRGANRPAAIPRTPEKPELPAKPAKRKKSDGPDQPQLPFPTDTD